METVKSLLEEGVIFEVANSETRLFYHQGLGEWHLQFEHEQDAEDASNLAVDPVWVEGSLLNFGGNWGEAWRIFEEVRTW